VTRPGVGFRNESPRSFAVTNVNARRVRSDVQMIRRQMSRLAGNEAVPGTSGRFHGSDVCIMNRDFFANAPTGACTNTRAQVSHKIYGP